MNLKQRVCELYPSQHQDVKDNTVRIEFELEREAEIATAVGKTFSFSEVSHYGCYHMIRGPSVIKLVN